MMTVSDRDYLKRFYQAVDIQQGTDQRLVEYYVPIYSRSGMEQCRFFWRSRQGRCDLQRKRYWGRRREQ